MSKLHKMKLKLAQVISGDDEYGSSAAAVFGKSKEDTKERPDGDLTLYEKIYKGDPIVATGIDSSVVFTAGAGVTFRFVDDSGAEVEQLDFKKILRRSKPKQLTKQICKDMKVYGNAYVELIQLNGRIVRLDMINPKNMRVVRDMYGNVKEYVNEVGDNESDYKHFTKDEIVHFKNREITDAAYGISDIEAIAESAEILRDMGIDLANFISTKAYPPIVWKLGTSDKPWSKKEIIRWGKARAEPEAGDQISVSGDVTAEVVGVAKQTLDISSYLQFYAAMIVSGLGIPATMVSLISDLSPFTGEQQKHAFKRRINELQSYISETLEIEAFDRIIATNRYGNITCEMSWVRHDDEDERVLTNNVVQLKQNAIISPTEARLKIGYPEEVNGVLGDVVDKAEGGTPTEQPEAQENDLDKSKDDDERVSPSGEKDE